MNTEKSQEEHDFLFFLSQRKYEMRILHSLITNSGCTHTFSSTPAGTTMGLKESECGQMGVIMMAGTLGWIMEAPAATAYAVLPVGVDTITPEWAQRHMHSVN